MNIDRVADELISSNDIDIKIKQFFSFIKYYFQNGRPQILGKYQYKIIKILPIIMDKISFNDLCFIIPEFYQFCYTVSKDILITANQKRISRTVLIPFANAIEKKIKLLDFKELNYEVSENNYVIYCRHAVTQGLYAPGKQIYTIVDALLKSNKKVLIYVRGQTDKVFKELEKKNGKLSIINKNPKSNIDEEFIELKEICIKFKPIKIITEIPLGLSTVLYMSKISSKILFWSAGFHQVPWFDYKLLVPEIYSDDHSKLPEFVKIPHSLNYELLNPFFELDMIDKVKKNTLKLKSDNFVIGTFARYEKISEPFLKMVLNILNNNSNIKFILAGPNDQSLAKQILNSVIKKEQALLFGSTNTQLLGNCCDIFLDTFPIPCGYSALEMMAKGKPVVVFKGKNLGDYAKVRLPELIFEDKDNLEKCIKKLAKNNFFYKQNSDSYKNIAIKLDRWEDLAKSIISI